jgi:hypothetical protein
MKTLNFLINAGLIVVLILVLSAGLYAQNPDYYNYATDGTPNMYPYNVEGGKMVQALIPPGTLINPSPAPAGNITKFYTRVPTIFPLGPATYTEFQILMAQSTITEFTGAFYSGPMDTVYSKTSVTLTAAGGTWLEFELTHPFAFNPAQSLIVQIGHCGVTGSFSGYSMAQTVITVPRKNSSVGGCPFFYSSQTLREINCGITVASASSINRTLLLPTPGVNTNYVIIPHQSSMVGFGNNITIEGWIKVGGTTTPNTVLNKGASSFDYQLGINSSPPAANPFFRAQTTIVMGTAINITAGVWTHLAVVSNGTSVIFYVNGVPAQTLPTATTLGASSNVMRIGRGGNDPSSGRLDEIRLWGVARTPTEIASNMCVKYLPLSTPGLKAVWHLDSNFVDSVSGYNGTAIGNVGFDTMTFCPIVTGITGKETGIPNSYKLERNYPNPFNPTTNIQFSIPKSGYVEIKIYDMLGKEITTLVSDPYQAGTYIVSFDASSLSSGIYFYRISVNDFVDTKKMILIK